MKIPSIKVLKFGKKEAVLDTPPRESHESDESKSSDCSDESILRNIPEKVGTLELSRLYHTVKKPPTFLPMPKAHRHFPSQPTPLNEAAKFLTTEFPQPALPGVTRPFRILAIDGGGVRGILPAAILRQLEVEAGKPISEMFDLIAGTSTGAILATMLALPESKGSTKPKFSANDGVGLYLDRCPEIFHTTLLRRIKTLSGLASAQYSGACKRKVLEEYMGDTRISDLLVDIIVPSFDIREGRPYFFKSSKARRDPKCDYLLTDVLDATSSAPTYFAPHKVEGYDAPKEFGYRSFVDGALTANSPALCALAEAYRNYGADPANTVLVSLGCGASEVGVDHEVAKHWGGLSWAPFFPNVMLSSSVNTVHYQLAHVVPPAHYFRVQTDIPAAHADIDNVTKSNLNWLADHGSSVASACRSQLKNLATLLHELDAGPFKKFADPMPTPDSSIVQTSPLDSFLL
ncbi:hypothetical protein DSO57_1000013 [Entomophthora muscae]|uniref:Uncharacterized protein n=1 Tax=Entomophthora muscae TaxID=34485 RepID=A0ACC2SM71_9FUNG|nr:hypothetical protein DSO57_1000013 [Entomophthora muscae]